MNEKHPENVVIEEIVETQEESEQDDEIILRLFADGEIVSWAKTLLYSFLKEIHTAHREKRKGYGRKLLVYIEKNAKAHGATTMKTSGIDHCNDGAVGFFRSMGYRLRPIEAARAPILWYSIFLPLALLLVFWSFRFTCSIILAMSPAQPSLLLDFVGTTREQIVALNILKMKYDIWLMKA